MTNFYVDGTKRDIDPAVYLTETAQKGNIKLEALHNGNSLPTRYKGTGENVAGRNPLPGEWTKKLLSPEDSGVGMLGRNDPIAEMMMTAFSSLMLLAVQIDNKNEEEQKTTISKQMDSGRINLKSLLPDVKNRELTISENGKAILRANNGELRVSCELTTTELSRLSATPNNNTLIEEAKRIRVAGTLNTVIPPEVASQNFEQGMSQQQGQTENLKRQKRGDMVKCVMIQLCRYLFGLSYLASYVLFCYQLFGWIVALIIVSVQLFLAGWLIQAMI